MRGLLIIGALAVVLTCAAAQTQEERIVVDVRGAGFTSREIEMIVVGDARYLAALESFDAFGIKSGADSLRNRYSGFFKSADSTWTIDVAAGAAKIRGKDAPPLTSRDYIVRDGRLYLELAFFKSFFGVDLLYNPRRVQIQVRNAHELPSVVAVRRLRALESRIKAGRRIPEPELYLGRDFRFIGGGLINWSTNDVFTRYTKPTLRNNLNIGIKALGGDFTGRFLAVTDRGRQTNTFRGNFRYPFFGDAAVRQIIVGDILDLGVIPQEITGVQITNRPAAARRLFTQELFRGNVDPRMDVTFSGTVGESMLEYADDNGAFQFSVPELYGNGLMEVRAYDTWGQERVLRYRLNIPQSLIPPGQFEYSLALGKDRIRKNPPFTATNTLNWGLSPNLTVGTLVSYYDFTSVQYFYPGITSTARVSRNVVATLSFVPAAFGSGQLSWEFASTARINLQDTRYPRASVVNPTGIVNDLSVGASVPIATWRNTFYFSVLGLQTVYNDRRSDELQTSISTTFNTLTPSLTTRLVTLKEYGSGTTTQVREYVGAMSFLMPAGLHMLTSATVNGLEQTLDEINLLGVKHFENGLTFSFSYDRNYALGTYSVGARLTYYLPFARAQAGATTTGADQYQYNVSGFGSVSFNTSPLNVRFSDARGTLLGNGGFVVSAYLDTNGNGRRDKDEQSIDVGRVYYSNLTVGGPPFWIPINKPNRNKIFSYENYKIFLDPETLDNPFWVPQYRAIQVFAEPNLVRRIDIPVVNGGIVRGTVRIAAGKNPFPAEGITVQLTSIRETPSPGGQSEPSYTKVASTFSTGEFEFLGVPPGKYVLTLDAEQLGQLQYTSDPVRRELELVMKPEGDIIEGQTFTLVPKK